MRERQWRSTFGTERPGERGTFSEQDLITRFEHLSFGFRFADLRGSEVSSNIQPVGLRRSLARTLIGGNCRIEYV